MAPPTGASDSILVLRRNGASAPFDRCCGALAPNFQKFPMDASDHRFRQSLGDTWPGHQPGRVLVDGQMIEASGLTVHPDYLNKYGTLSNGMWTKSVKFAEAWLYGTVGLRPAPTQRPSLFLYPGVMSPGPRLVKQPATCYVTSEREPHVVSMARKHVDQCFGSGSRDGGAYEFSVSGQETRKCGDRRLGNSRNGSAKGRSSSKEGVSAKSVRDGRLSTDPYNLVRKSRLGAADVAEPIIFGGQNRRRNASVSPLRGLSRDVFSFPFETFKPKLAAKEVTPRKDREEKSRRKSILECDVNVYELNKSRRSGELEESSDDFAKVAKAVKVKSPRPKLNETENRTDPEVKPGSGVPQARQEMNLEVRLGGQRFKIADDSGPGPGRSAVLTASDSPKRPPRRHREKSIAESALGRTKSWRSKSSPNLSIKSILKTSATGDDQGSSSERSPFDEMTNKNKKREERANEGEKEKNEKDENGEGEAKEEEEEEKKKKKELSEAFWLPRTTASRPSQVDRLPNDRHRSTYKKKKQVQFRVNNLRESREKIHEVSAAGGARESTETAAVPGAPNATRSSDVQRSKSCEDLALLKGRNCGAGLGVRENEAEHDGSAGGNTRSDSVDLQQRLRGTGPSEAGSALRRSYSDRRLGSGLVPLRRDVESSRPAATALAVSMFNDTMALRTRTTKPDTREVFLVTESGVRVPSKDSGGKRLNVVSVKATGSNTISYAEFSKLPDVCDRRGQTPRTPIKSRAPIKLKSPSPSPPPRHATHEKSLRNLDRVPVNVCPDAKASREKDRVATGDEPFVAVLHPMTSTDVVSGKTVVTLGTNVVTDRERGRNLGDVRKASYVAIHPENVEQGMRSSQEGTQRKTSVIISNFHGQDSNKVTISVRNDSSDEEPNSSTCTIIETGSNSTVIPVVSMDNKTTLIVGSNSSAPSLGPADSSSGPLLDIFCSAPSSNRYTVSTVDSENLRRGLESLDPVEAVRRNLVPHICGKREGDPKTLAGEDDPSTRTVDESRTLSSNSEGQNEASESRGRTPDDSWPTACVDGAEHSKAGRKRVVEPENCSEVSEPLSGGPVRFYVSSDAADSTEQEKDKLECEYEIRNGFRETDKHEEGNLYEGILEEPLYDRIKEPNEEVDSVPLHLPPSLPRSYSPSPTTEEADKLRGPTKSMFEGASKYDILNYLVDAKERVGEDAYLNGSPAIEVANFSVANSASRRREPNDGDESLTPMSARTFEVAVTKRSGPSCNNSNSSDDSLTTTLKSVKKSSAEIERNDSGVGSETSHVSRSRWQVSSAVRGNPHHLCEDCDQVVETQITDGSVVYVPLVCRKCSKKRSERKEIIQEIVETEEKYGRDLKIILEEFYTPMLVAGLLTPDQLSSIFLNTEELLENSELLTERLRDTLDIAADQGDEDLVTVNVGKLFLEAEPMLHAFESYCTRQGAAAMLLAGLEKEKELLRIFLRVSQMENAVLRRMNLNSFLMVPVQRVTKYPLLLARLYKVTPTQQEGRELLKEAQHNIELHLEHMNSEAKDVSATKVWRRFSTSSVGGRKAVAESEMVNIKLRKMAVDVLDWNHEEVRFILEGKLFYTQPTDNNWKRGRTIKLSPAFVLLATLGKPNSRYKVDPAEDTLTFPAKTGIREATMLLVKEKCGRYSLIREPLYLDKIIVCCETEVDEFFEVQELSTKESFIFKAEDGERTKEWYKQLQYHAQILGAWRKRRNALANIMINGMLTRACAS